MNKLLEYMNLHLISLMQDSEQVANEMAEIEDLNSDEYQTLEIEDISINGQIIATRHLMSVAKGMIE